MSKDTNSIQVQQYWNEKKFGGKKIGEEEKEKRKNKSLKIKAGRENI